MLRRSNLKGVVAVLIGVLCAPSPTRAVDAGLNPAVRPMVDRAIGYIEKNHKNPTKYSFKTLNDPGFGEHAIIAYAHMKVNHDSSNPVVQQGIKAALDLVGKLSDTTPARPHEGRSVYSVSVSAMLLAEVDAEKYRRELAAFANYLKRIQYPNGSYSYPGAEMGDISQTQYAMLALWTMERAGIRVDYQGLPKTISWVLRVQDPSGGWPYMGVDPGVSGRRVKQKRVTASMATAGGSAVLIAGDILRLWGEGIAVDDPGIPGLPKAIKLYREGLASLDARRPNVPTDPIFTAIDDCDNWLRSNSPNPGKLKSDFPHYQLYTTERYYSFREVANGDEPDPDPPWFREGLSFLRSTQSGDGAWPAETGAPALVTTSFAILFLIRSTQKAIAAASSGTLAGGYELPSDTTDIRVEGTQIKGRPIAEDVTKMLSILEEDGADDIEGKSIPDNLELDKDPGARAAQLDRLERLVRGSRAWQARRVAARLLGKSDELRVVPALIFALSDPDKSVRQYARDGLRFISRKFDGFGMPDDPELPEMQKAQRQWRAWYRTMDPKYVFLDYDL